MHLRDAKKLNEFAEQEKSILKSLYARHSIISSVFASEALINRFHSEFYIPSSGKNFWEKASLFEKWYMVPMVCGLDKPPGITFQIDREPFQSFRELIKIRNWLLHPKPGNYFPAFANGTIQIKGENPETVPWVDVLKGNKWPQTKIPINPFELSSADSKKVLNILIQLISKLFKTFKGIVTESWLNSVGFIDIRKDEKRQLTIDSLWGGYTPEEK